MAKSTQEKETTKILCESLLNHIYQDQFILSNSVPVTKEYILSFFAMPVMGRHLEEYIQFLKKNIPSLRYEGV